MPKNEIKISPLFLNDFEVDERYPFFRHLNRLEVEIGKEDYSDLKRVSLLEEEPDESLFQEMEEITVRLLSTTQNKHNRDLLTRIGVRIYLDHASYSVYYRLPERTCHFTPLWRNKALKRFYRQTPQASNDWRSNYDTLPGFEVRFIADHSGGVLLLRSTNMKHRNKKPILTSSHGPYDPHTFEVVLYMLKTGRGGSAMINLGFAGREPLSQQCLEKLSEWGIPLNPSNIDVIYPYLDANGDPCCYKLERGFAGYVELIKTDCRLSIDIHGCVGTTAEDKRVIVGIGGAAPFPKLQRLGKVKRTNGVIQITPKKKFSEALTHLRDLSTEIYIQLCEANTNNGHDDNATIRAYNFALLGQMQMIGFEVDKNEGLQSLLEGEERLYVVRENIRWLPGAGANALQRMSAQKIDPNFINLHVELPTMIRKKMLLKLRELEINDSLASSSL